MKTFLLILLTAFPVFGQLNIGNPFFAAGLPGSSGGYGVENDSAFPLEFALYPDDIRTNTGVQQWPMRYNSIVLSNKSIATTNWAVKSDSGLNGKPTANFYGSSTASPYFHGNLTSVAAFQITMVVSLTNNNWMSGNTVLWDCLESAAPIRRVLFHTPTSAGFQLASFGGITYAHV